MWVKVEGEGVGERGEVLVKSGRRSVAHPEEGQLKVVIDILVPHVVHGIAGDPQSWVHLYLHRQQKEQDTCQDEDIKITCLNSSLLVEQYKLTYRY